MAGRITRRVFNAGLVAATSSVAGLPLGPARADQFPARAITIVVGTAPGGPTDTISRAAAQRLAERFKQNVIIENRAGASGNLAAQTVAKAEPDGYTLITLLAPLAQNQATFKTPGFNIQQDFKPIAHMASTDMMIVGRSSLPVRNLAQLIAHAQANPGKLSVGSQSPPQGEYLKRTIKVDINVVPYRGSQLITNDVIGGQIDLGLVPYSDVAQHIASGSVVALFNCGPKRITKLPAIETVAESFAGFGFWSWYGFAVPAKTPDAIVDVLRKELGDIARSEDFRGFVSGLGLATVDQPDKFGEVIDAEVALWKRLVDELALPRI